MLAVYFFYFSTRCQTQLPSMDDYVYIMISVWWMVTKLHRTQGLSPVSKDPSRNLSTTIDQAAHAWPVRMPGAWQLGNAQWSPSLIPWPYTSVLYHLSFYTCSMHTSCKCTGRHKSQPWEQKHKRLSDKARCESTG